MTDLEPLGAVHRALLEQLRADEDPSVARLDAVLARVLEAGPLPATVPTHLVLLGGGLLAIVIGALAIPTSGSAVPERVEPALAPLPALVAVFDAPAGPVVSPEIASLRPADATPLAITPPPTSEPSTSRKPRGSVTRPRAMDAAARATKDGVAEEVALMGRLRHAIQTGASTEALSLVRQHEARYPHGVFEDERRVSFAEALCAAGDVERARELASAFVADQRESPLASRARRACARAETETARPGHEVER